jgi:alkylation response protein AidB-like acyl-CoA dehydrogenase
MGWLAMPLPEAAGGFGFGMQEAAIIAETFGRHLVLEPLVESAVLCGGFLAHEAVADCAALLEQVGTGEAILAFANEEPGRVTAPGRLQTTAEASADGYRLRGSKRYVIAGAVATHYLVTGRLDGEPACFVVSADAEGLARETYPTHDGRCGANLELDLTVGADALLAQGAAAADALLELRDRALLATSAEALGLMQAALDSTVDYTRQREQFGQALSSFQALQHRMADMLIAVELARSLVQAACTAFDSGSADARRLALAAKIKTVAAARRVTQEAIQLHGGIATTEEYIVGHFFKRATALESWPCSRDEALADFVQLVDAA